MKFSKRTQENLARYARRLIHRLDDLLEHPHLFEGKHRTILKRVVYSWERALKRLLPLGGISTGNEVTLFFDGDQIYDQLHQHISQAQSFVWIEIYMLEPDTVGYYLRNALIEACQRGCEVILIYDHIGSSRLTSSFLKPLTDSGAKVYSFNPIWPWRRRGTLLFRDHRKIIIIDGKVGFCGGINFSEDYAGTHLGTNRFYDALLKLKGPAVNDLAEVFLDTFQESSGETRQLKTPQEDLQNRGLVQVLSSNKRRNLRSIQHSMEVVLNQARQYCYFTTPYFLPYPDLSEAMIAASRRGIDVRILTAGLSDVPLMRRASRHIYGKFLEVGIKIYEMYGRTLHAKISTIDGVFASVGSYNLDHWSARRNLEVTVCLYDPQIAQQLKDKFIEDLSISKEVTWQGWLDRSYWAQFMQWNAYQLMRL